MPAAIAYVPNQREATVYARVTGIVDPIGECYKRWPDFTFEVEKQSTPGYVGCSLVARWTRNGARRVLGSPFPFNASEAERRKTSEHIAIAVLLRDEHEKAAEKERDG